MDEAALGCEDAGGVLDDGALITTWHEGEPLVDVAHFLVHCTTSHFEWPPRFLVLLIGGSAETERAVLNEIEREATPIAPH